MILSDREIRKRLTLKGAKPGDMVQMLKIEPFDENLIQPASIDIRLGAKLLIFSDIDVIDPFKKTTTEMFELDFWLCPRICLECHNPCSLILSWQEGDRSACCRSAWTNYYDIKPGEFLLGSTLEYFEFPNDLVGRIEGRSSIGRLGLLVHITAGYIDPGFRGFLTLELKNLTERPFRLRRGMSIGQVSFAQMTSPSEKPYKGRYQDQEGPEASKYHLG